MSAPLSKVDEARAAALLGLSKEELRRLARESGVGHEADSNGERRLEFTYEELHRLCQLATHSA